MEKRAARSTKNGTAVPIVPNIVSGNVNVSTTPLSTASKKAGGKTRASSALRGRESGYILSQKVMKVRQIDLKQDATGGSRVTSPFSHGDYLVTSKMKLEKKPDLKASPLTGTHDLVKLTQSTNHACVGVAGAMTGRHQTDETNNVTDRHAPIIVEINKDLLNDFTGYVDYTQMHTYAAGSEYK